MSDKRKVEYPKVPQSSVKSAIQIAKEIGDPILDVMSEAREKKIKEMKEDTDKLTKALKEAYGVSISESIEECGKIPYKFNDTIKYPKGEGEFMMKVHEKELEEFVYVCGKPYRIERKFNNMEECVMNNVDEQIDFEVLEGEDDRTVENAEDVKEVINIEAADINSSILEKNPFDEFDDSERMIEEKRRTLEEICEQDETTNIIDCVVGDKVVELEEGVNCHLIDINIFNSILIVNIGLCPIYVHIEAEMNSFLDMEVEFLYEKLEDVADENLIAVKDVGSFRMSVRDLIDDGLAVWHSFDKDELKLNPLEFRGLTTLYRL